MVGSQRVRVDEEKMKVIQRCPTPINANDVRSFHMLANFYRCFHHCFPLNEKIKKDVEFKWEEPQEKALQSLKELLFLDKGTPQDLPLLALLRVSVALEQHSGVLLKQTLISSCH
ncbi:hypothetical protein CR513_16275, partial [Mucuna pruriens]